MTTETVEEVPPNPFTLVQGVGMQWLEYESTYVVVTAPSIGERRNVTKTQPMRLDAALPAFGKVVDLYNRCLHFEKECERLRQENEELYAERALLQQSADGLPPVDSGIAAESGKRGRRQRGE